MPGTPCAVVCEHCGTLKVYDTPTRWKTIRERAEASLGAWGKHHDPAALAVVEHG